MSTITPEVESLLSQQRSVRIGDVAPNFETQSQLGPFNLYDFAGNSWCIIFSHPRDFTPVCTTELGRVGQLNEEWKKRNVKVCALSVDTVEHHREWIKDIKEIVHCDVNYPILDDHDYKISVLYGMLDRSHLSTAGMPFTVRNVFVIDPKKVVRLVLSYPASTGRNFDEILRVIDSLQLTDSHKVATPADWKLGQPMVVLPTVSTENAHKLYSDVREIKPWYRLTSLQTKAE